VMSMKRKSGAAEDTSAAGIAAGAGASGSLPNPQSEMEKQLAENAVRQALIESEELNRIKLPESTRKTEVLVKHIRESAIKDPVSVTNVLRSWIGDTEGKRT
jgi:flagellar biosynthesis/type III secretory pathway M-ring protein FliF/YscJ